MPGRFHCHHAILRAAQQLQQLLVTGRIFSDQRRPEQDHAGLIDSCHHVPFRPNIDTDKSQRTQTSSDTRIPRSSTPRLTLQLVHARTPAASQDTVRAPKLQARAPI